eukprot:GHVN01011641.1.p1 GENE.GHVN01011641.1~~GHVN01011641.1.p1  ORF type:complete len:229 (+),score=17.12 GHVN01011641.1:140-826(+)
MGHKEGFQPIVFTGGYDDKVIFWDAVHGEVKKKIYPGSHVNQLQVDPECELLAVGGAANVKFFNIQEERWAQVLDHLPNGNVSTSCITLNITAFGFGDTRNFVYTGCQDATVRIWDTRQARATLVYHNETASMKASVNAVALHPDRTTCRLVFGDAKGAVQVWDVVANKIRWETLVQKSNFFMVLVTVSYRNHRALSIAYQSHRCSCAIMANQTSPQSRRPTKELLRK